MIEKVRDIDCSVIIPIFNGGKTLSRLFSSIGRSDRCKIEFILINDGSTDNSLEICSLHVQEDTRFVVINKPNEGVSSARNLGLLRARGRYIFFLDADDVLHLNVLEKMIDIMTANDLDLIVSDFIDRNITNGKISEFHCNIPFNQILDRNYVVDELFKRIYTDNTEGLNNIWNKLYRHKIIKNNNLTFDESRTHGEDWKFVINYLYFTHRLMAIPDIIIDYMIDGSQIISKYRMGLINSVTESINIKERLRHDGSFNLSKREVYKYRLEQFIGILKFLRFDINRKEINILKKTDKSKSFHEKSCLYPKTF